ncbi:MAG TPA: DUF3995 domain-containing protein [Mucilaginibacter sp.]
MKILIASFLVIVFIFLAAIHIYWAFGGKNPSVATIPTTQNNKAVINPGLFDCLVVAIGLLSFGLSILIKSGVTSFSSPGWLMNCGLWAIAAIFILRAIGEFKYIGFFKKIKTTKFGQLDTKYYAPLCLLIGILCVILEFID